MVVLSYILSMMSREICSSWLRLSQRSIDVGRQVICYNFYIICDLVQLNIMLQ